MAYPGYLFLDGSGEIINNARAYAYLESAGVSWSAACDPCTEDLTEALCQGTGDGYWDPETDDAPWYDAHRPESGGLLGIIGTAVSGTRANPITRVLTDTPGEGASLGPLRRDRREITWTVTAVATSEASIGYAAEWLTAALMPGGCQPECGGAEIEFFAACPCTPDCFGWIGGAERRTMLDVGLLEGPNLNAVTVFSTSGCDHDPVTDRCGGAGKLHVAEYTFTLVAGRPRIFAEPIGGDPAGCVQLAAGIPMPDYDPDVALQKCLERLPGPCAADPDCPAPAAPPRPTAPVDPCFPAGPFDAIASYITVPGTCVPEWNELHPVIEVSAGNAPLRRLIVRFRSNPADLPCEDVFDPCNVCFDVHLPYLPAGGVLVLDSRVRNAYVLCDADTPAEVRTSANLFGTGGAAFSWPVLVCPTAMCVEVITADDVDACASAHITLHPASDAI